MKAHDLSLPPDMMRFNAFGGSSVDGLFGDLGWFADYWNQFYSPKLKTDGGTNDYIEKVLSLDR